jgi:VIT1/CCC1 family predicted Fe2+/Mn2+ transporter
VLVTGLAGLLAGALSMGAGEYVSVRSQRELLEASSPDSAANEAVQHLDVDANELALVYRARGMTHEEADAKAADIIRLLPAVEEPATDIDEHESIGTGLGAAAASFCFFASGAVIPVLPYLFGLEGYVALAVAAVLVGLALICTGLIVGLLSGGPSNAHCANSPSDTARPGRRIYWDSHSVGACRFRFSGRNAQ